jgi:hypothetical protein
VAVGDVTVTANVVVADLVANESRVSARVAANRVDLVRLVRLVRLVVHAVSVPHVPHVPSDPQF